MLRLVPPVRSLDQLKALAASGSSGFARRAQAELLRRTTERLREEMEPKK